jgi:Tfp pilus assembly protein PilF
MLLGQTQIQQNELEQAESSLKKAVELAPEYTDAYYALSSISVRRGDRDAALAYRNRFAELKARDRELDDRLALVPDLDMVRQRTAATLCGASTVWLGNGDSAEANRLLLRAAAIAPGLPEPYKVLASLYQAQGRIADALVVQQRLVQLDPNNVFNHVNLANLTLRSGNAPLAEEILQEAIRTHPDAAVAYSCLAQLWMQTGKPEQARSSAEEWIRLEPTPDGYMLLASACQQLNDPAGSEAALREMRKLESKRPR